MTKVILPWILLVIYFTVFSATTFSPSLTVPAMVQHHYLGRLHFLHVLLIKTTYCKTLNTEAEMGIQLSSNKPDILKMCKNIINL